MGIQKYTSMHKQRTTNLCTIYSLEKFRYITGFAYLYTIYNTFGYDTLTKTIDYYQYYDIYSSILYSIEDTSHLTINKAHDVIKDFVKTHIPIDRPNTRIQIATPRHEWCIEYFIFRYMVFDHILNINTLHRLYHNIHVALHYKHSPHLKNQNEYYNENQRNHNRLIPRSMRVFDNKNQRRHNRRRIHETHQKKVLEVYKVLGKIPENKLREVYKEVGDGTVRYVILDKSHKMVGMANIVPYGRPITTMMGYEIFQDDINATLKYLHHNLVTNQPDFSSELQEIFINTFRKIIAKLIADLETNHAISASALEVSEILKTIDAENRKRRKNAFDKLSANLDTKSKVSVSTMLRNIAKPSDDLEIKSAVYGRSAFLRNRREIQFAKHRADLETMSVLSASNRRAIALKVSRHHTAIDDKKKAGVKQLEVIIKTENHTRCEIARHINTTILFSKILEAWQQAVISLKNIKNYYKNIKNSRDVKTEIIEVMRDYQNTTEILSKRINSRSKIATNTPINCKYGNRTQVGNNPCASNVNDWYLVRVDSGEDILKMYTALK